MSGSIGYSLSRRVSGLLCLGLWMPLLVAPMVWASPATAQVTSGKSHQIKSSKTPGRYRETGRYRGSTAQQSLDAHRQRHRNRGLVSPTGGAANVDPNFYLQLGGTAGHPTAYAPPRRHYSPSPYYSQPYVVYINEESIEPPVYGDPGAAPQAVNPQPIYIVNQQPAPQVIQVPSGSSSIPEPVYAEPPAAPPAPVEPRPTRSTEPQDVSLSVQPADASVYLDDEPLGSAAEAMGRLTTLKPGIYVLEVSHSSYSPQRLVFGVSSDPVAITIDLTADRPGRRARVK